MKLNIIQSPANPTRLWIVDQSNPTEQFPRTECVYAEQFERPITLVGHDPDHLLISSLKMFIPGKLAGFESWQEAAGYLAGIEDVSAAAAAYGTTIETLIYNGHE
jgi:hypothetical protein